MYGASSKVAQQRALMYENISNGSRVDDRMECLGDLWAQLPDDILFHVFTYLPAGSLLNASQTCKSWYRVAMDDFLWRDLFYEDFKVDRSIGMAMGKESWQGEYKRLYYHTPLLQSEVLTEHRDQVLHVSFSHNGKMFATSSKDGFIKVWNATFPASVRYNSDLKEFTWKYTQFSQFNENDTLLLVSGVHFGSQSTSGEIAVFSLQDGFELQCRVLNKPYDIFGTWYNDMYLLSGNLHWMGHLASCSTVWLNKASQALDSEQESVVMPLFKLHNVNASSVRTIMVANCTESTSHDSNPNHSSAPEEESLKRKNSPDGPHLHEMRQDGKSQRHPKISQRMQLYQEEDGMRIQLLEVDHDISDEELASIEYNNDYRLAESEDFKMAEAMNAAEALHSQNPKLSNGKKDGVDTRRKIVSFESSCMADKKFVETSTSRDRCLECEQAAEHFSKYCNTLTSPQHQFDDATTEEPSETVREELCMDSSPEQSSWRTQVQCSDMLCYQESGSQNVRREFVNISTDDDDDDGDDDDVMFNIDRVWNAWQDDNTVKENHQSPPPRVNTPEPMQLISPSQRRNVSIATQGSPYREDGGESIGSSREPLTSEENSGGANSVVSRELKNASQLGEGCSGMLPSSHREKYLIFTTGTQTYTPHQIGIKKIGILEEKFYKEGKSDIMPNVENNVQDPNQEPDKVDHLIELHGHIIGMCLSPDHRYLYVNSRPWPQGYNIEDPLYPPPIAQEIDIHVIDLQTMKEVGTMHRAHKAYTPNDECFFIFLDVCGEYVASGAEDKHGYLWDRHYGVCLAKFEHADVVNSVAFNPKNPEVLITASDDFSLKIWRSRNQEKQVKESQK